MCVKKEIPGGRPIQEIDNPSTSPQHTGYYYLHDIKYIAVQQTRKLLEQRT